MPRTALPVTTAYNDGNVPTATAIDPTNDHVITPAGPAEELLISVNNTTVSAKTITIKAGANPPALAAGQGDLVVSCDASTNGIPLRIDSSRYVQADGTINLDAEAAMTGTIVVYKLAPI